MHDNNKNNTFLVYHQDDPTDSSKLGHYEIISKLSPECIKKQTIQVVCCFLLHLCYSFFVS